VLGSGKIGVVIANAESLSDPFGSVGIATLDLVATAPAGTVTSVSVDVLNSIDSGGSAFSSNNGFSAEITVNDPIVPPSGPVTLSEALESNEILSVTDGLLFNRATAMRPIGEPVLLNQVDGAGNIEAILVQAIDPAVPTD